MVDRLRLGLTSGFVSVALWIVVYTPQIWECYTLKSGEGLSVVFLLIWLTGDLTGVAGALAQKLTPTIALLGIYYAFCDILLLYLLFYYRHQRRAHPEKFVKVVSERTPLLENGDSVDDVDDDELTRTQRFMRWVRANKIMLFAYSIAVIFILVVGIVAWITTGRTHNVPREDEEWSTSGQIVGWMSAFLYLSSRIPQIIKNMETKCQGLSLMMFCFSVLGNVTYCMQILLPSTSYAHVYINFSWLVGAAGTIILDFIVLGQFVYYRKDRNEKVFIEGGESQISGI